MTFQPFAQTLDSKIFYIQQVEITKMAGNSNDLLEQKKQQRKRMKIQNGAEFQMHVCKVYSLKVICMKTERI